MITAYRSPAFGAGDEDKRVGDILQRSILDAERVCRRGVRRRDEGTLAVPVLVCLQRNPDLQHRVT